MAADQIFKLCNALAMVGWAGLVFTPRWTFARDWVAPVIAPLLIAIFYTWLMVINSPPDGGGFGSLSSVMILFSDPNLLLAGWIHYLAFDLFVGAWEVRDAQRAGIHHLLVVPCLFATLMAGPAGLACYWLLRLSVVQTKRKQSKIDNSAP
ncbi:MAG: hypothetical protein CL926_07585 [Deltaproteobacteria bacterium]|jgi:hypothetical protein|nr:hypothetical protein [Deltaproteobacteria bacterium]|tara:strand:+ start:4931 stop:5383 length:453 start_codon:yes stop_codon:yes gene_type:complete